MRSSTSNSSDRIPGGPWRAIWITSLIIVALALASIEGAARSHGHVPSVVDDPALWSQVRQRLANAKSPAIALLGASRIQLAVSPDELEQQLPAYRVYQLAIEGSSPIATLRELADDPRFGGIVVCAMNPSFAASRRHEEQAGYVQYYHRRWSADVLANRMVRTQLQQRLVACNPSVNLTRLAGYLMKSGDFPPPLHVITYANRSRRADFSLYHANSLRPRLELEAAADTTLKEISESALEQCLADAQVVEPMIRAIEQRGGAVVFVRLPSSQRMASEREFWRRLTAQTAAETIDFEQVPGMANLQCPDGSHIDQRDIRQFTWALAGELRHRGIVDPRTTTELGAVSE
ncbi:MAG: hypothetical protein KDA42_06870 [Planctomycetales bacterium]|nr:hypothetical protein [Planctomycetales bacterium]